MGEDTTTLNRLRDWTPYEVFHNGEYWVLAIMYTSKEGPQVDILSRVTLEEAQESK